MSSHYRIGRAQHLPPPAPQPAPPPKQAKKGRVRSAAGIAKHKQRGVSRGFVLDVADKCEGEHRSNMVEELTAALTASQHNLAASQREVAVQRAAAQRSEQQRHWAVEAGAEDFVARVHMASDLKETEDQALLYMSKYQQADEQRIELYYRAKSSLTLAGTLMACSESDAAGKAKYERAKVAVVEQGKALQLAAKPHLAAAAKAVQGHKPFGRSSK